MQPFSPFAPKQCWMTCFACFSGNTLTSPSCRPSPLFPGLVFPCISPVLPLSIKPSTFFLYPHPSAHIFPLFNHLSLFSLSHTCSQFLITPPCISFCQLSPAALLGHLVVFCCASYQRFYILCTCLLVNVFFHHLKQLCCISLYVFECGSSLPMLLSAFVTKTFIVLVFSFGFPI